MTRDQAEYAISNIRTSILEALEKGLEFEVVIRGSPAEMHGEWGISTAPPGEMNFPLPVLEITEAIPLAIAEENEACALAAETWVDPLFAGKGHYAEGLTGCATAISEGQECSATVGIAAAIRKRIQS